MFLNNTDLKDIIRDNTVHFVKYRQGFFYYKVLVNADVLVRSVNAKAVHGEFYTFPVPIADIGDATLEVVDKAIFFMRYIRQAINTNQFHALND